MAACARTTGTKPTPIAANVPGGSLLLDAPTRSHFGPREETLEKKGYWTGAVEVVDLDLARVAEAVRRALAARARRKAAS